MDNLLKFLLNVNYYVFSWFGDGFKFYSFSSLSIYVFIPSFIMILVYYLMKVEKYQIVPGYFQNILEVIYCLLYEFIYAELGEEGKSFIHYEMAIFMFICILNLINLIPYCLSVTGQFFINLAIAFIICVSMIIIAIYKKKLNFWKQFVPSGLPLILQPFMFMLEFSLFWLKPITLAFRLALTLTVGHMVMDIIIKIPLYKIFIYFLLMFIIMLEILFMFVQSYIFTLLTCIYLKDMIKEH